MPGTGLGLSIVRSIVTMLGGSVDLRSRLGHGTTVEGKLLRFVQSVLLDTVQSFSDLRFMRHYTGFRDTAGFATESVIF